MFSIAVTKKEAEALARENEKAAPLAAAAIEGVVELPLIVKADVAGSIDAILHELAKITHERATVRVVASGVGSVSEGDAKTAQATGATIIAFSIGTDAVARDLALRENIPIETFSIIYELTKRVSDLLAARAPKVALEKELGRAEVLKTFSSGAKKQVLGAKLVSGALAVGEMLKILRKGEEVARGKILNLQQARADVREIRTEGTFGTEIETRENAIPGDELVTFTIEQEQL